MCAINAPGAIAFDFLYRHRLSCLQRQIARLLGVSNGIRRGGLRARTDRPVHGFQLIRNRDSHGSAHAAGRAPVMQDAGIEKDGAIRPRPDRESDLAGLVVENGLAIPAVFPFRIRIVKQRECTGALVVKMRLPAQTIGVPVGILPDHPQRHAGQGFAARPDVFPDGVESRIAVQIHFPEAGPTAGVRPVAEVPAFSRTCSPRSRV